MQGYLSLILHAHLPFVRHPEHPKFLEENWLFEAITETYIPLIQVMDGWLRDGMDTRLTLTLSPTLCSMLLDPVLQDRYQRHLEGLIELAEKEIHRTHWDEAYRPLAWMYHHRFTTRARHLVRLRPQPRRRVPQIPGAGQAGNHHHRRDPRGAAVAREPSAIHPRANSRGARPLSKLLRLRSARHLAAGMRLRGRR